jgi:hypothetical protein
MPNIAAAKPTNSLTTRLIKYIPAEMITLYTSASGVLSAEKNPDYLKWAIIIIMILTPLWRYFSVNDNPSPLGESAKKAAFFNAGISLISIWLYINVNSIESIQTTGLNIFVKSAAMAALLLLFFSIAIVPLMERIILGKPIEASLLSDKN